MWDQLQQHRASLEAAFRRVPGFKSWYLIRTPEGLTTVTLCDDRTGAEESVRTAANWVRENMPDMCGRASGRRCYGSRQSPVR
jgi:hypothetical protein